eukprot:5946489-Amphidinium_carterae.1
MRSCCQYEPGIDSVDMRKHMFCHGQRLMLAHDHSRVGRKFVEHCIPTCGTGQQCNQQASPSGYMANHTFGRHFQ